MTNLAAIPFSITFLVVGILSFVPTLRSQSCDLPNNFTVCASSHVYANDDGTYYFGDGSGGSYQCITIGPSFRGTIVFEWHAQNADNYLCVEQNGNVDLGNMSPKMHIFNYGDITQYTDWPSWGGSPPNHSLENFGRYTIDYPNVEFDAFWDLLVNHPGGVITGSPTSQNIIINGPVFINHGEFNVKDDLILQEGSIFESYGNLTIGRDFKMLWGDPEFLSEGSVFVGGSIDDLGGKVTCVGCNFEITNNLIYEGSVNFFELFDNSVLTIGGDYLVSSSSKLLLENSNLTVNGEVLFDSHSELVASNGEITLYGYTEFIDEALFSLTNVDLLVNNNMHFKPNNPMFLLHSSNALVTGNLLFGSAGELEAVNTELTINGNLTFESADGKMVIDLSVVQVGGNVDLQWNAAVIFPNCGLLDVMGHIYSVGPFSGPVEPAGMVVAVGDITLYNSAATTSGHIDFCAGGQFDASGAPPLGPDITFCEYEAQSQLEFPFTCDDILLGAEFLSFTATYLKEESSVELKWKTDEDGQSINYEVQWGSPQREFKTISDLQSTGNWNTVNHKYVHQAVSTGTWFYRIVSSNDFGKVTYSPLRVVHINNSEEKNERIPQVFPNPAVDQLNIVLDHDQTEPPNVFLAEKSFLRIYNLSGKLLRKIPYKESDGQLIQVDVRGLPKGIYILRLNDLSSRFVIGD